MTNTTFLEIETPSYDEGYFKCMERNGIIKSNKHHINVAEISSITRYVGKMLHEGWDCSKIKMKNGDTFIDKRTPSELLNQF